MTPSPSVDDVPSILRSLRDGSARRALTFYRGRTVDGRLTYGELADRAEGLAGYLAASLGVKRGDRVAVLSPNRLEIPVLVLALLRLGAVVVPLNPTAAPEDWSYVVGHSGARVLMVTKDLEAQLPPAARPEVVAHVEELLEGERSGPAPSVDSLAESPAVVLYTSGTTGRPKGVVLRQRNLVANARSMARNFGLGATTQLAVLPLYHAHAFGFGLMTALTTGGHLVFTERLEPFDWAEVIRAEAVEVTSVVPPLLPMLLAARVSRERVPTLRHILVSSAPLPATLAREFEEKTKIPLIQGWGLSEYTNFACCMPVGLSDAERAQLLFGWEVPSIGPELEGTSVKIVDASGAKVGAETKGELLISGHSTMLGYFLDDEATARTIERAGDEPGQQWLRTGDEGFFRMHGGRPVFFVTGRLKEIIIRDAEKYSPLALERRILDALPELAGKLVVLGFPHRTHGEEVGAYLEVAELDAPLRARLVAALEALAVAERPKVVLYGAEPIPRTHTGKIQRRKLLPAFERYQEHRGAMVIAERAAEAATRS